jgi:hypothetical protein
VGHVFVTRQLTARASLNAESAKREEHGQMFSTLRTRVGIPGVIAVTALVFAMIGGAYAANSNGGKATASAKGKRGPRGAKGAAGPAGPVGPVGPAGSPGAAGKDGAAGEKGAPGTPGAPGAAGKGVVVANAGGECPIVGGITVEVEGSGSKKKVCNGKEGEEGQVGPKGDPWVPDNVLPPQATETGTWAVSTKSNELFGSVDWAFASFPFPIPLSEGLASDHTHLVSFEEIEKEEIPTACDNGVAPAPSVEKPEADPGELCVFIRFLEGSQETEVQTLEFGQGASPTGGILKFSTAAAGEDVTGIGSFAVTAPAAP